MNEWKLREAGIVLLHVLDVCKECVSITQIFLLDKPENSAGHEEINLAGIALRGPFQNHGSMLLRVLTDEVKLIREGIIS